MSAFAVVTIALFVALVLWGVTINANLTQRDTIAGLRSQLKAEQSAVKHWRGVAEGYHDAPGARRSSPRAAEPVWRDKAGQIIPTQRGTR